MYSIKSTNQCKVYTVKILYVNEKTHRRIKALAVHDRRTVGQYLEIASEQEMRRFTAKQRNEMYARLDEPRIVPGGNPKPAA